MDDNKLFTKNEKKLEALIQTVRIYSQDIGMEFGIEKCTYVINEKWQMTHNGRSQTIKSNSHQNAQRKGNLKILEDIGSWHHQTTGNERKN